MKDDTSNDKPVLLTAAIGLTLIVVLWLITPWVVFTLHPTNFGRFGDLFGSVNALFSGLAFLGVIVTILLQRQELKEQRKELKLTRGVHEESVGVLENQRNVDLKTSLIQSYNIILEFKRNEVSRLNNNYHHSALNRLNELSEEIIDYTQKLQRLVEELENEI